MTDHKPLVSCLLISQDEPAAVARAVHCFQQQSWEKRELVVIDHSRQDITPLLEDLSSEQRILIRPSNGDKAQSSLLNLGLEHSNGGIITIWNRNDWHHPERIRIQAESLSGEYELCRMTGTLLHLDHPEYVHHPYIDLSPDGYEGSLMFRKKPGLIFPDTGKNVLRKFISLYEKDRQTQLDSTHAWLMVRGLYGSAKSKDFKKFVSGFRNNTGDFARFAWLRIRGKNMVSHPRFKLDPKARKSFYRYMSESRAMGVLRSVS